MCQDIAAVKAKNKTYFTQMTIADSVKEQLTWFNAPPCKKPWLYGHLDKPFLFGRCIVEDDTVVLDQDQTLQMWAASRVAIMSVLVKV